MRPERRQTIVGLRKRRVGIRCDAYQRRIRRSLSGERRALNVICLTSNPAILTALANDYSYESVFARQTEAHGQPGAVLLGLSTSGNSANVVAAFEQAHLMGMQTVALTGEGGGRLAPLSDYLFAVPSRSVPLIQQAHLCLYHYLCESDRAGSCPAARSSSRGRADTGSVT